jgi:hypothetical protein
MMHHQYSPPLNAINPISPRNPNLNSYMRAARSFLQLAVRWISSPLSDAMAPSLCGLLPISSRLRLEGRGSRQYVFGP